MMLNLTGSFCVEYKIKILELTSKNDFILMKEEEKMRLKSRSLWIEACDMNTHFFHRYASHHKNINTIWEIWNEGGIMISS